MIINTELANALKFQAPFDFNNNMVHYSLYFLTIYFKKFQPSNMAVKIQSKYYIPKYLKDNLFATLRM